MAAPRRFFVEDGVYHTISVTRGRKPLFRDRAVADLVLEAIVRSRAEGKTLVLAYVLMPDHLHLLCVPLQGLSVSDVMKAIKGISAKAVNKAGLYVGPLWQQSFHDRVIRDDRQLSTAVQYIHHNPVAAKLVLDEADYPFSSAHPSVSTDLDTFFEN